MTWDGKAKRRLDRLEADGYGGLPVRLPAQDAVLLSPPTRPLRGAPIGHDLHVREVWLSAGAGFVVLVVPADAMTMPWLLAGSCGLPDRFLG